MDSRYENRLTDLAKRLRPLLLSVAEGAMNANEWDNIILIVADGGGTSYYDPDATGFAAAIAAASSGDTIYIPPATISGNHTIGSGITVKGMGIDNTILSGEITISGGTLESLTVSGSASPQATMSSGVISKCAIETSSATALQQTGGLIWKSQIFGAAPGGGTGPTLDVSGSSNVYFCNISWGGAKVSIDDNFYIVGTIGTSNANTPCFEIEKGAIFSSIANSSKGNTGFQKTTAGTGFLYNCASHTGGTDVDIDAGTLNMFGNNFDGISGTPTYLRGDRGSYSVENWHAEDIEDAALVRHLPSPVGGSNDDIAYIDTELWVRGSASDAGIITGPESKDITASENLAAGDLVDIWNDGGTAKARLSDTSDNHPADGYVVAEVNSGNTATVYINGINDELSGMTPGAKQFLTTSGGVTETAPSTSGYAIQEVGIALSATEMKFEPQQIILLA